MGSGDHGFLIEIPAALTSLATIKVVARSATHGDTTLPVATEEDRMAHELFDAVAARYDRAIARLTAECDRLRERLDGARGPSAVASVLPEDIERRLVAVESRLDAAEVAVADATDFLRRAGHAHDLVFLDPPFALQLWSTLAGQLEQGGWLAAQAWIYVESPRHGAPELPASWQLHREGRAGEVRFALYRRTLPLS